MTTDSLKLNEELLQNLPFLRRLVKSKPSEDQVTLACRLLDDLIRLIIKFIVFAIVS